MVNHKTDNILVQNSIRAGNSSLHDLYLHSWPQWPKVLKHSNINAILKESEGYDNVNLIHHSLLIGKSYLPLKVILNTHNMHNK